MMRPQDIEEAAASILAAGMSRRCFVKLGTVAAAAALTRPLWGADSYRVGIARGSAPYQVTRSAIEASGEWPNVTGKVVVIKPNLVADDVPESGKITDAEVTRAVVDRALVDEAALILIVESSPSGANFDATGYQALFSGYDPGNRVHLLDLRDLNTVLAPNPNGWIYKQVYVAGLLRLPRIVFIDVGKLKTHVETTVTLTSKNLFGLPDVHSYLSPRVASGRFGMHDRGVSQTILDLNLLRPTDFAIIDGIWAAEGRGPLAGTPIQVNTVLAGKNVVAVDRVALEVMGVAQTSVRHLAYLSGVGLGPSDLGQVDVVGDPLMTYSFELPKQPPEFDPPRVTPSILNPTPGRTVSISTRFYTACFRRLEVVRVYDDRPDVDHVRTLSRFSFQNVGVDTTIWDGRAEDETVVTSGRYAIRVTSWSTQFDTLPGAATSWVWVV